MQVFLAKPCLNSLCSEHDIASGCSNWAWIHNNNKFECSPRRLQPQLHYAVLEAHLVTNNLKLHMSNALLFIYPASMGKPQNLWVVASVWWSDACSLVAAGSAAAELKETSEVQDHSVVE